MKVKEWFQKKFAILLVRHLFNAITVEDIITVVNDFDRKTRRPIKRVMLGGKQLDSNEIAIFQREAEQIRKMALWKLLGYTVKYNLNIRMFKKGEMLAGQMGLYNLEIFEKTIDDIEKKL